MKDVEELIEERMRGTRKDIHAEGGGNPILLRHMALSDAFMPKTQGRP